MQLGFVADEVEQIYPEIIEVVDGYKYISFSPEQLRDKRYWRIINTLRNEHTIMKLILQNSVLEKTRS
jgi:hypothetical protein